MCEPAALLRLLELALWMAPPTNRHLPRASHPALLLLRLMQRSEDALAATPAGDVAAAVGELHVPSEVEAQRLHAETTALAAACPPHVLGALDTCWCAGTPAAPPYVCAYLEAPDLRPSSSSIGRFWVVDLRRADEFEAAHFALTMHLPPERAREPAAREAARDELFAICAESGVGLAFLTAGEPTAEAGCSGLHPDEVALVVDEFISTGFARVGAVRGGFAAVEAQLADVLVVPDVMPTAPARPTQQGPDLGAKLGAFGAKLQGGSKDLGEKMRGGTMDMLAGMGKLGMFGKRRSKANEATSAPSVIPDEVYLSASPASSVAGHSRSPAFAPPAPDEEAEN